MTCRKHPARRSSEYDYLNEIDALSPASARLDDNDIRSLFHSYCINEDGSAVQILSKCASWLEDLGSVSEINEYDVCCQDGCQASSALWYALVIIMTSRSRRSTTHQSLDHRRRCSTSLEGLPPTVWRMILKTPSPPTGRPKQGPTSGNSLSSLVQMVSKSAPFESMLLGRVTRPMISKQWYGSLVVYQYFSN